VTNPIQDLYLRANTQTIDAADHNTVVYASQFLYENNLRGYPLGDGRDGHMQLGVISATTTSAPTLAILTTGNLTGTFYYKYSACNLSGETAASTASSTISPSAQCVTVTIPATGSNTNITGFYIYRSADNVTYYRVGQLAVADATNGGTFIDNNPITSGTAPQGSNTSTTSATLDGFYQGTSFTMTSGQSITITADSPVGLYVVCQGNIDIQAGATITGTGAHLGGNFILGTSGVHDASSNSNSNRQTISSTGAAGSTDNAGTFVVGRLYVIESAGDTDFTLVGAANSTVGTIFTATGVGTGTGTARRILIVSTVSTLPV
jgi:hypothetical protein